MYIKRSNRLPVLLASLLLVAVVAAAVFVSKVSAVGATQKQSASSRAAAASAKSAATAPAAADAPAYHDYKGVAVGMSAAEARQKLGSPEEKSDQQDFFVFSEKESARVIYDAAKKVSAVAVTYLGADSGAPGAKQVFGEDIADKGDGSLHKMERYPKAGYWVSYSRTPSDPPMVTIMIQKM